jgi:hypothetical protein
MIAVVSKTLAGLDPWVLSDHSVPFHHDLCAVRLCHDPFARLDGDGDAGSIMNGDRVEKWERPLVGGIEFGGEHHLINGDIQSWQLPDFGGHGQQSYRESADLQPGESERADEDFLCGGVRGVCAARILF